MSYPHSRNQIHELVQPPKFVRENSLLEVESFGERFDLHFASLDGKDRLGYITSDCIMPVTS